MRCSKLLGLLGTGSVALCALLVLFDLPLAAADQPSPVNLKAAALSPAQIEALDRQGFFLTPQAKARKGATHLFQVYERNDYLRFPSFVTADLAVDLTHTYFSLALRKVESATLASRLKRGLKALVTEATALHDAAPEGPVKQEAARALAFWCVGWRLSGGSAKQVPAPVRERVEAMVKKVEAASGPGDKTIVESTLDLTQMKPRGHYTRSAALKRYFRSMSWLGMATFAVAGEDEDAAGLALVTRAWLGAKGGREDLDSVLEVTSYVAGQPDTPGLDAAAERLKKVLPGAESAPAATLLEAATIERFRKELADLPTPRIDPGAPAGAVRQVRVMGRRAFEDAVAVQRLLGPLLASRNLEASLFVPVAGALGAATVLGSDPARDALVAALPAELRAPMLAVVPEARAAIAQLPPARFEQDAYHATLDALRPLLAPPDPQAPAWMGRNPWLLASLQTFAGGWTELRHDTLLYGEQLGAECDAPEYEPPRSWVQPVPAVYARLAAMIEGFEKKLAARKITLTAKPAYSEAQPMSKEVLSILRLLEECATQELAGRPLKTEQLGRLTQIGGEVEWALLTLNETDLLAERDKDMAVVADVFTFNPTGQVVEVAVAHPDLVFAVVPGPKGPLLARGAVMSYREWVGEPGVRLTDEQWKELLQKGKAPGRPAWLKDLYLEPAPKIRVPKEPQDRCGPSSGAYIDGL